MADENNLLNCLRFFKAKTR